MNSTPITASNINSESPFWHQLIFTDDETYGEVRYQVFYDNSGTPTIVPDSILAGNSSGFETSPVNLKPLSTTTYPILYLYAFFYSGGSPILHDWGVSLNSRPNTPTLDSPTDTAISVPTTAVLKTTATDNEGEYLRYKIQLCTNLAMTTGCQTFDETVSQTGWSNQDIDLGTGYSSGTQAIYTVQTALSPNTQYFWRSYAIDRTGTNLWSDTQSPVHSFTTSQVPNTPTLDAPINTSTKNVLTTVFKTTGTDADSDNLKYKIQVCTNLAMTTACQTFDQTSSQTGWTGQDADTGTTYASGTQATYTVQTDLSAGTTYYWRSYAKDEAGSNTWSSTQGTPYSFTTDYAPTAPTLDSPTNGASEVTLTPVFKTTSTDADGDYIRFKLLVCTEVSMAQGCLTFDQTSSQTGWSDQDAESNTAYASGTQATYTFQTNLLPGKTYYWHVLAIDEGGSNTWSSTNGPSSFTTMVASVKPAPCSVVKANNNSSITVNWTDNSTNEDYYQVWKVTDGGLPAQLGSNLAANTIQLLDSSITPNHSYGYLIRAIRIDGSNTIYSEWCAASTSFIPGTDNSLLIN